MAKEESFPVRTLDECFESVQRANALYRGADPKTARSLAKALGAIAEEAIGLDEQDPDRLRVYMEALATSHSVRDDLFTPRVAAIARARMHRGGPPATVLASVETDCSSPHSLAVGDASARATLAAVETDSTVREQLRNGTRAQFHINQYGRMALDIQLVPTLDIELPRLHAISARQLVHVPTGRVLVEGGMLAPVASIDVPIGWYDVVLCTFDSQRRILILFAPTERRSHDPPCVDFVPTIGLLDKSDE